MRNLFNGIFLGNKSGNDFIGQKQLSRLMQLITSLTNAMSDITERVRVLENKSQAYLPYRHIIVEILEILTEGPNETKAFNLPTLELYAGATPGYVLPTRIGIFTQSKLVLNREQIIFSNNGVGTRKVPIVNCLRLKQPWLMASDVGDSFFCKANCLLRAIASMLVCDIVDFDISVDTDVTSSTSVNSLFTRYITDVDSVLGVRDDDGERERVVTLAEGSTLSPISEWVLFNVTQDEINDGQTEQSIEVFGRYIYSWKHIMEIFIRYKPFLDYVQDVIDAREAVYSALSSACSHPSGSITGTGFDLARSSLLSWICKRNNRYQSDHIIGYSIGDIFSCCDETTQKLATWLLSDYQRFNAVNTSKFENITLSSKFSYGNDETVIDDPSSYQSV